MRCVPAHAEIKGLVYNISVIRISYYLSLQKLLSLEFIEIHISVKTFSILNLDAIVFASNLRNYT
jgi:hypothetical protein